MTLIVTAVGKSFVIQASDRRLTTPSGALHDDNANKALCVACRDAVFAMAYTGLAQIGSKRIDEWLAKNHGKLSASARENIATLINPEIYKDGGTPRTPGNKT